MNNQPPQKEQPNFPPAVLTEKDAAHYVGMSVAFLRADRMNGHRHGRTPGPPFLQIGRAVRYRLEDLDRWLEERLVDRRRA